MSGKDEAAPPKGSDIEDELQKAMSEAEAAVDAVRGGEDEEGGDVIEIEEAAAAAPANDERIAALEADKEQLRDKWLRAVADHENYRKRVKRDVDDAVQAATARLLEGFLPTVDNLERAMTAATDDDSKLVEGIKMVTREFMAALAKHDISPIESVGRPFDPNVHDALQQIDSPDHAPGVIVQEFEKGYLRGGRLLRPARVIVAGPGSTGPEPEPAESAAGGEENTGG